MKRFAMACMLAVGLAGASASAEPVVLKFAFPGPPSDTVWVRGLGPWAKDVTEASGGTLEIKPFMGPRLANFRTVYDRILKGVADMGFGIFGATGGQFPKTDVAALPFETDSAHEGSLAMWRLFEKGVIADEFSKVKVLVIWLFPHSAFHAKRPIRTLEDLAGLKVTVSGRATSQNALRLGAVPVSTRPPQIYQSINRGIVDGSLISWLAVPTFKIQEVTSYHLDAPLSSGTGFAFMNKASYARLPAKAKAAIDRYAGAPLVERMGKMVDAHAAADRAMVERLPGQTVVDISPAEKVRWRKRLEPQVVEWVKATPDGAKVLAAFRAEIQALRAGK